MLHRNAENRKEYQRYRKTPYPFGESGQFSVISQCI